MAGLRGTLALKNALKLMITLPKTNSSPLKMMVSNRNGLKKRANIPLTEDNHFVWGTVPTKC